MLATPGRFRGPWGRGSPLDTGIPGICHWGLFGDPEHLQFVQLGMHAIKTLLRRPQDIRFLLKSLLPECRFLFLGDHPGSV